MINNNIQYLTRHKKRQGRPSLNSFTKNKRSLARQIWMPKDFACALKIQYKHEKGSILLNKPVTSSKILK